MGLSSHDTPERYGVVSRALHWSMAALFAWQFLGMILHGIAEKSALAEFFKGTHSPLGALLFLLVVIRALWALGNRARRPAHAAGLLGRAASLGHFTLYALMIVVPALALLRSYGTGRGLNPFGLFQLIPRTGVRVDWMVDPANALHGPLAWALLALIGGHVAMVLVHKGVFRDGTLARMAG
jgi:cytochrome b561